MTLQIRVTSGNPDEQDQITAFAEPGPATDTTALAQMIRRLLADHEDARKALNRARARFEEIGDQLAELRYASPDTYADAYREATR